MKKTENEKTGVGALTDAPLSLTAIAHIRTDFPEKFGIPRQSGLVPGLRAKIIFEPEYRVPEAFRGIEGYSHLWLLWQFSRVVREGWQPTVRPPRLGGNTRMGVFATRSPYRPNPVGLSSVRLLSVDYDCEEGPCLWVGGADLLDGTPIYDIKPYLAFTDSHPDAVCGFADERKSYALEVRFPEHPEAELSQDDRVTLTAILSEDPRPSYQSDAERIYYLDYRHYAISFRVADGVLTVLTVAERRKSHDV